MLAPHADLDIGKDLDIQKVRADTPACEHRIHFNNAGASLMPQPVYETVTGHLQLEQRRGGYEAAAQAEESLASFYRALADLLNAHPQDIAYVENATRAWDMAMYGIPFEPGDRVLTHTSEYASNYLALLQLARHKQIEIDLVPSDATGQIDTEALTSMIGPRTRAIAITHVPSQGGLVNPVVEVGRIARRHNLIYALDACQSCGQLPVDVAAIGCDILTGTGRKFLRGPRGTGFLYVSNRILSDLEPPFIDLQAANWVANNHYELRGDARRFENWERYVAGQIGLAEAARYACGIGLEAIGQRITTLADTLRRQLASIPGVEIHDQGATQCGIVTFTQAGQDAQTMVAQLRERNINTSATLLANARLDLAARDIPAMVRASIHYFNTEQEIARFCETVESLRGHTALT